MINRIVPSNQINENIKLAFINSFLDSISSKNLKKFMTLHKSSSTFFNYEQVRWFNTLTSLDNDIDYKIENIFIDQMADSLSLNLQLSLSSSHLPSKMLRGEFKLLYIDNNIYVDSHKNLTLYTENVYDSLIFFEPALEKEASIIYNIYPKLIQAFSFQFNVSIEHKKISIYLFNSSESISFSIPDYSAYGWYESNESIKIFIPDFVEDRESFLINVLTHELAHLLLVKISNDNLSLFFQEGFAMYVENYLLFHSKGLTISKEKLKIQKDTSLDMLKQLQMKFHSYNTLVKLPEESGIELYHNGFLWVYYLIEKYGLNAFLTFVSSLAKFDYINSPISDKFDLINERTTLMFSENFPKEFSDCNDIIIYYDNV